MSFIGEIIKRAKQDKKRIVLPESMDERVLKAAEKVLAEDIAEIVFIGKTDRIKESAKKYHISKAFFLDPETSKLTDELAQDLFELRKHKGLSLEDAKKLLLEDYMYYACMLVKTKRADGVVSGACHSSANTLRPALQIIKTAEKSSFISAFFFVEVPDCEYGLEGTFLFADSGLEQNPTPEKLAEIAASSAESFHLLTEKEPVIAMLSHSTMGSASHPDVEKVVEATKIAKEKYPQYQLDGELQLDAAIVPEVAHYKAPESTVAGHANVLIFPDLDAGNIGYKLVERLAKANAYGPITQGIAAPINDLSRGCSAEDIVGVIAITAVQAQKKV